MKAGKIDRVTVLDAALKLALDRTFLAYERTLMAWIRTAVSLIGFGFGTYKFFQYLDESAVVRPTRSGLSARHFAVGMISVGIGSLIIAVVHQRNALKLLGGITECIGARLPQGLRRRLLSPASLCLWLLCCAVELDAREEVTSITLPRTPRCIGVSKFTKPIGNGSHE